MEPENLNMESETTPILSEERPTNNLNKITPLSKYLAMLLFIIMPFFGGWIGYRNAPEKIVEVETIVEIESLKAPVLSEEFSDLYTYTLPATWYKTESEFGGGMKIVTPPPTVIEKPYIDEQGYFHDTNLEVFIHHLPPAHIFNEDKTLLSQRGQIEYATLLSAIYRSDDEFGQAALSSLDYEIYPATLFKTKNQRFQGVSRINTFTQDYSFFAHYELLLIDTLFGDMIFIRVDLEGEEIDLIRPLLTTPETDQGEFQQAQQAFLDLLNSKSRDELSFGYLMDDLEDFANSLEGINERKSY